ncbi:serine phosphatase RsbU (regulator of sigma subunit) [Streptacidiphilus sp. MAP12-16]|uniref:SpoIIE family protein phosphatase n=1 Tax=Streptacidiphilus sp. MAP12-16 TaxID=3156300 RepID=UPI003517A910
MNHRQPPAASPGPPPARSASAPTGVGRLAATVDRLREALAAAGGSADVRAVVECATGILMERMHCDSLQARRQLDHMAAASGQDLLEIAADVVTQVADDPIAQMTRARAQPSAGTASQTGTLSQSGAVSQPSAAALRTTEAGVRDSSDPQRAAEALLEHALTPLGAHAVALWTLVGDGSLVLSGHAGFHPADTHGWHHVPPGVPTLARRSIRTRTPVWHESGVTATPFPGGPHAGHVRAAVAAVKAGQVLGTLEVCWPGQGPARTARTEQQLSALADLSAYTLSEPGEPAPGARATNGSAPELALAYLADSLHDPAIILSPMVDQRGGLLDFRIAHTNDHFVDPAGRPTTVVAGLPLLQAYPLAAQPGGLFDKVEHTYATGEPFRAEHMALTTLVDQVPVTAMAAVGMSRVHDAVLLTWRLQDRDSRLATLLQHAQRLGRIGGFEDDLITLQSTWNPQLFHLYGLPPTTAPRPLSELRHTVHPDDQDSFDSFLATLVRYQRPASVAVRLQHSDHVIRHLRIVAEPVTDHIGTLIAIRGACQDVSAHHWTEIALTATRDQLAHTEAQAAENAQLTRRLQHAIMPPTPQAIEAGGLRIAVRYRPAHQDHAVGGDWYDAVPLPGGTVLLAVGDVAGHGINAATGMVVLRNALRGLATTGAGPAQLLVWLNAVAFHLTDHVTATAVCGIYDPRERVLRWARAGHLPPILVSGGGTRSLDGAHGILLGAIPDAGYQEEELRLQDGDTLLLFTDGLIERKDHDGEDDLHATLRTRAFREQTALTHQLDHILTHSTSDTDDDTCLIGIHLPLTPAVRPDPA